MRDRTTVFKKTYKDYIAQIQRIDLDPECLAMAGRLLFTCMKKVQV